MSGGGFANRKPSRNATGAGGDRRPRGIVESDGIYCLVFAEVSSVVATTLRLTIFFGAGGTPGTGTSAATWRFELGISRIAPLAKAGTTPLIDLSE